MAFEKITENVENISLLSDTPAMSTEQLKKEFDKGNKTIKTKFNQLIDELNELVVDDLATDSETNALSAKQGKVLNEKFNYSTEEQVVGTWIDGKPIYRKVLTLVLTSTSSSGVSQDVADLNIDAITHIEGISQSDPHSTNYTWDATLDKFRTYYDPNRKEIRAQGGSSYPTLPCTVYVILEYTKTTD